MDLVKKSSNLKGSAVISPHRSTDGVKSFSGGINIHRGFEDYQIVISNTYHGRNIETDYHVI